MDWLPYSIASVILLGTSAAFWKMPSFKQYSKFISTLYANAFSLILALVCFFAFDREWEQHSFVLWLGLGWGVLFAVNMALTKMLLSHVESNSATPVTSAIGHLLVIFSGILFLSEEVTALQLLGMLIMLGAIFFFTGKNGSFPLNKTTALLTIGVVASSLIAKLVQKVGAQEYSLYQFMVYAFIGATIGSIALVVAFERKHMREVIRVQTYWKGSLIIAVCSVLGGYAVLVALSKAPVSLVYSIHPAYTLVVAVIGAVFFKEKLTPRKVFCIFLSITGIVLISV